MHLPQGWSTCCCQWALEGTAVVHSLRVVLSCTAILGKGKPALPVCASHNLLQMPSQKTELGRGWDEALAKPFQRPEGFPEELDPLQRSRYGQEPHCQRHWSCLISTAAALPCHLAFTKCTFFLSGEP